MLKPIQQDFDERQPQCPVPKAVDLRASISHPFLNRLVTAFEKPIERALALDSINRIYRRTVLETGDKNFFQSCLDVMQVRYCVSEEDLKKIPAEGPLVVVSNHPFGGIEGVLLHALLREVRPDVKALANYLLHNMKELREWMIPVDPFGTPSSKRSNLKGMKQAVEWVKNGGALITFPAGEVSSLQWRQLKVLDPAWSRHIGALIQHSRASALPIYFPGKNSLLFQALGLLHPKLRTIMLPREFANKQFKSIEIRIGKTISAKRLAVCEEYEEMVEYLRMNTYFLQNRAPEKKKHFVSAAAHKLKEWKQEPIISETPKSLLLSEVNGLPERAKLVEADEYTVYVADAPMIPNLLNEIGRLRELTFREVGEGTGKSLDLDRFDAHYLHLFLWNKTHGELAGAYRMGVIDRLLHEHGRAGLYTSTLFKFKPQLLRHLENAVELGRSFIRSKYQKEYSSLSLLWRGIGEFIVRNQRYNILFGPVSISNDYHAVSRNLMVQFLRQFKSDSDLSRYVRPRTPYRARKNRSLGKQMFASLMRDIDDVSLLISEIEQNGRGIPILLRHYLKLNATILSFNLDKHFSNVVDGLIFVDLTKTDTKLLKRFMGKEGFELFAKQHAVTLDPEIERLARIAAVSSNQLEAMDISEQL